MSFLNEHSNMSYTNKDFNSIYVELLEYAKKISYKWDPTASDESDPGVVLLKLAALIGDKNNYNIDQNVLELMPASVSQDPAARQIFEQCGYSMRHYVASEGYLDLTLVSYPTTQTVVNDVNTTYTIPRFTMFTDNDSSVVYTLVDKQPLRYQEQASAIVMEGTAVDYSINNDKVITLSQLDNKNRIYFTDFNIAENGIFVRNVGHEDHDDDWTPVDNLEIQPLGEPCFKFGLSLDGRSSYIEFPSDIASLIGEGLNITYIRTNGKSGNIAARKLKKFYSDTTVLAKDQENEESITVSEDNVYIINSLPIITGQDPESIDEAYRSYQRVKNTFDTLVTTKDYSDYMITEQLASNAYVCDRTDDIQRTYKKLTVVENTNVLKTIVNETDGSPEMTAFDLCVYGLTFHANPTSLDLCNQTFLLMTPQTWNTDLTSYYNNSVFGEANSIQHDFKGFEKDRILLIKNKYPIKSTIIPKYKLSPTEQGEVLYSIETALSLALNSNKVDFGSMVAYDYIYDTIVGADERIKAIVLDYPEYQTYAVYWTGSDLSEIRIDSNASEPKEELKELYNKFRAEIFAKNVVAGVTPLYTPDTEFTYGVSQTNVQKISGVRYITTETTIPLTQEGDIAKTASLLQNENILITAPSLVLDLSYSTNTKFVHNIQTTVPSGSQYQLKDEECVVLFWKESNEDGTDSSFYKYRKYSASSDVNVIKCTFDLKPATSETVGVNVWPDYTAVLTYFQNSSAESGTTENKQVTVGVSRTTKSVTEIVKSLTKSRIDVISGTDVQEFYSINKIHINSNDERGCNTISWILNSTTKDKDNKDVFKLFGEFTIPTEEDKRKQEYTLKTGEYFLYTTSAKKTLHLLGEGTVISREFADELVGKIIDAWTVPYYKYEDVLTEGMDAVRWKTIEFSDSKKLCATEMERYLIGPDNFVKLTETLDGPKISDIMDSTTPFFSNDPLDLQGYQISYGTDSDSLVSIPYRNMDGGRSWKAQSILNIDVSSTSPQKLEEHQSMMFYDEAGTDKEVGINTSGKGKTTSYILTNRVLSMLGGVKSDVTLVGSLSVNNPVDILAYDLVSSDNDNINYSESTFLVTITNIAEDGNGVPLNAFQLLPGDYLLHISAPDPGEESEVYVRSNSTDVTVAPIHGDTTASSNFYFVKVPVKTNIDTAVGVELIITSKNNNGKLDIQPLMRYDPKNSPINTYSTADILGKISELDPNMDVDYINYPEDTIPDPLVASSFHLSQHVYNKFSIDQWACFDKKGDLSTDIKITSNIR